MRTAKAAQCRFEIQVTDLADMTDHAPRDYGSALRALSISPERVKAVTGV
jgi:hypothetical protein